MKKSISFNPIKSRPNFFDLCGEWLFSFDKKTWRKINVPFCPESALSGIGHTDFINACYYKKAFDLPQNGLRSVLHFGAVDYRVEVFVNGSYVGSHDGGYTPFEFDIKDYLNDGQNLLELTVYDSCLKNIPRGKQSFKKQSFGCFYTRTTGVWQPVWIEFVPENHIKDFYFYPDIRDCKVVVDLWVSGKGDYQIIVMFGGKEVGRARGYIQYRAQIEIPLDEKHLWEAGKGDLYDIKIIYEQDEVNSYFGLREVRYEGYNFLLNDKPVYQKLVLIQGYHPEGIYTEPGLEAMQKDIDLALSLGFNGARLHQKVFDPRFLYLCDKAGFMVWGEFPSWGIDYSNLDTLGRFLYEWGEVIKRDFNHPSIVIWCPLNEVWDTLGERGKKRDVRYVEMVYEFTKALDATRPCVDASGGHHGRKTDLYDFHCYEPLDKLKQYLDKLEREDVLEVPLLYCEGEKLKYPKGLPVMLSECGGTAFINNANVKVIPTVNEGAVTAEEGWGYGKGESDGDAFVRRYKELVELISKYKKLSGFCYTQLYDVEQEKNGFYNYDRSDKLTEAQKRAIAEINKIFDNR